jgi:hypothetical protein
VLHASLLGGRQHRPRVCRCDGERLFADQVTAERGRVLGHGAVRIARRGD